MSKQLPSNANLKHLKNQAKHLLDAHKAGDENASTRFKTHIPRLSQASKTQVRGAKLTLRDAYLVLAREYGYTSWPKLKHHLEAHAIIQTPDAARIALLQRLDKLTRAIGKTSLTKLLQHLPQSIPTSSNHPNTFHTEKTETLEHIERLAVTLKYVLTGGKKFAQGALSKSFGPKKASQLLDQITPISGFLQLSNLTPQKASTLLSNESPETIAHILSHLDTPHSLLIFNRLSAKLKKQITPHLDRPPLSETESRHLDLLLTNKIAKTP